VRGGNRKEGIRCRLKDKELTLEEIESSHTRWSRGRSCPREWGNCVFINKSEIYVYSIYIQYMCILF